MPQYFIESHNVIDGNIEITGEDFHHIVHVRRTLSGDEITLRDELGRSYRGTVLSVNDTSLEVKVMEVSSADAESIDLILCMSLLKGKNFDLVIQKAVEVGVKRIVPFVSERTISQPGEKGDKKVEKWNRVASEAAKQSLRSLIPKVEKIINFEALLDNYPDYKKVIAHPEGDMTFKEYLSSQVKSNDWVLLVGPEGGFSPEEISTAESKGWICLRYGFSQLRAETAGIVLPAIIIHETGS